MHSIARDLTCIMPAKGIVGKTPEEHYREVNVSHFTLLTITCPNLAGRTAKSANHGFTECHRYSNLYSTYSTSSHFLYRIFHKGSWGAQSLSQGTQGIRWGTPWMGCQPVTRHHRAHNGHFRDVPTAKPPCQHGNLFLIT